MHSKQTSITVDGSSVKVRALDGQRVKVAHEDGRTWIVAVTPTEMSLELTRLGGQPADIDAPDWLFPMLADLAQEAA